MSVDAREKRASVIGSILFTPLPLPDGVVGAGDRMQVSGVYPGALALPVQCGRTTTTQSVTRASIITRTGRAAAAQRSGSATLVTSCP